MSVAPVPCPLPLAGMRKAGEPAAERERAPQTQGGRRFREIAQVPVGSIVRVRRGCPGLAPVRVAQRRRPRTHRTALNFENEFDTITFSYHIIFWVFLNSSLAVF